MRYNRAPTLKKTRGRVGVDRVDLRAELAALLACPTQQNGMYSTALPSVFFMRHATLGSPN